MTTRNLIDNYSLRTLSPFSGTTHIIQQQDIRAISNNGVNWRIQIQATTDTLNQYTLFALWTKNEGLKEFSIHHHHISLQQQKFASDFIEQLPDWLDNLSFPLRDIMECWLLDNKQQPLALLFSCKVNETLPQIRQPTWLPCALNDHTFVSSYLQKQSRQHDHSTTPIYHRDLVAQQLHQAANQNRQIQWFQRQADGCGIGQNDHISDANLIGRQLSADEFPHYLLRQYWDNEQEQQLIDDFFHWQSPWLLTLPDLSDAERLQLETQVCSSPQRLQSLYQLYPTLLQKDLIYKTLIQAKLEKAAPSID